MKIAKEKTVEKMLMDAQKNAKVRKIDSVEEVERKLQVVLDRLTSIGCWHENDLAGLDVSYIEGATRFPSAYKYNPEGTEVRAIWNGKRWEVKHFYRSNCNCAYSYQWKFNELEGKF